MDRPRRGPWTAPPLPFPLPLLPLTPNPILSPQIVSNLPALLRSTDPEALVKAVAALPLLPIPTRAPASSSSSSSSPSTPHSSAPLPSSSSSSSSGHPFSCDPAVLAQALLRDYSILASAYLLQGKSSPSPSRLTALLPRAIARPLFLLGRELGQPPIMDYSSYCLGNCYSTKDPLALTLRGPPSSPAREHPLLASYPTATCMSASEPPPPSWQWSSLRLIRAFDGGPEEATFVLIHSEIESHCGDLVSAYDDLVSALHGVWARGQGKGEEEEEGTAGEGLRPGASVLRLRPRTDAGAVGAVLSALLRIKNVTERVVVSQLKMFNASDPRNYSTHVRPWIFGWKVRMGGG